MYQGKLNLDRYSLVCSICKVKEGSCISCDYHTCSKSFHVRCAMQNGLILSSEDMSEFRIGDWDCKIFCDKHTRIGKKKLESLKQKRARLGPP